MHRASFATIHVRPRPGRPSQGWLHAGSWSVPVALGRGGVKANKREGDGGTPRGVFRPLRLWWRSDRLTPPRTALPIWQIGRADAWCEIPKTGATIVHFGGRPMNQAIGSGATIGCTT